MANTNGRPRRYRPVRGTRPKTDAPMEYSPHGTGCPAVEQAVALLYSEKNEESFWTLMSALNYALEMETRVLVPLQEAPVLHSAHAPWVNDPVPAEKAAELPKWVLHSSNGQSWLPLFTSAAAVVADRTTAFRPVAEMQMLDAMNYALDSNELNGVVIDPWSRSATLDSSLLRGLLRAGHDSGEAGEAELDAARDAANVGDWTKAVELSRSSAEKGNAEGLAMLGDCYYLGRGVRRSRAEGRRLWKLAADAGCVSALITLGDDCLTAKKSLGKPLTYYRKAQSLARRQPDIAYMPEVCLRIAQAETGFLASKRQHAMALTAEAIQGFKVRAKDGDADAAEWRREAEEFMQALVSLSEPKQYKESLQMD